MLEDIAILTGGKVITEDLGIKLENVALADLGPGQEGASSTRTTRRSSKAPASRQDIKGRIEQIRTQIEDDHLRLRPREAPGAAGQARRRRGRDQGRRRHRDRDEGEEGPRRGRPARHPRGRGRGHRARRRRGPAPRPAGPGQGARRRATRRSAWTSSAAPWRSRSAQIADNAGVDGSIVVQQVKRGHKGTSATTPTRTSTRTWSRPASSTRPRSPAPPCRTRPASPGCCSPPSAWSPRFPRKRRPRPCPRTAAAATCTKPTAESVPESRALTRTRFRGYRTPGRRPRPGVFICRTTGARGDRGFHDTWRCTPGPRSRGKSGVVAGRASSDGHPPRSGRVTRAWAFFGILWLLGGAWQGGRHREVALGVARVLLPAAGLCGGVLMAFRGSFGNETIAPSVPDRGGEGAHCSGRWSGRSVTVRPGLFGGSRAPSGSAWPSPWRSPSRPAGRSADLCGAALWATPVPPTVH